MIFLSYPLLVISSSCLYVPSASFNESHPFHTYTDNSLFKSPAHTTSARHTSLMYELSIPTPLTYLNTARECVNDGPPTPTLVHPHLSLGPTRRNSTPRLGLHPRHCAYPGVHYHFFFFLLMRLLSSLFCFIPGGVVSSGTRKRRSWPKAAGAPSLSTHPIASGLFVHHQTSPPPFTSHHSRHKRTLA